MAAAAPTGEPALGNVENQRFSPIAPARGQRSEVIDQPLGHYPEIVRTVVE
jgi:hypothetical protein